MAPLVGKHTITDWLRTVRFLQIGEGFAPLAAEMWSLDSAEQEGVPTRAQRGHRITKEERNHVMQDVPEIVERESPIFPKFEG